MFEKMSTRLAPHLSTGNGWHGMIDRAVINVHHPKMGPASLRWFRPQNRFTLSEKKLTWIFNRFEPDFDIDIEFNNRMTIGEELAKVKSALTQFPQNGPLKDLKLYLEQMKLVPKTTP